MELTAVCDVDKNLRFAFEGWSNAAEENKMPVKSTRIYEDVGRMMTEAKPEAVIISTPVETHAEIACDVAKHGSVKAVLLEKPIAGSVEDAERIVRTYRNYKVKLLVNHQRRWHVAWRKAYTLIRELGGCYHMVGLSNGDPLDAGSHMAHLFLDLAPKAEYTYVDLRHTSYPLYHPYIMFDVHAFCKDGRVSVTGNGTTIAAGASAKTENYRDLREVEFGDLYTCDYAEESVNSQLGAVAELRDLASNKRSRPSVSGSLAMKALEMCLIWR